MPMSQFLLPLGAAAVLVPGCCFALLLWLDRLEGTLDHAVQRRRCARATAEQDHPKEGREVDARLLPVSGPARSVATALASGERSSLRL